MPQNTLEIGVTPALCGRSTRTTAAASLTRMPAVRPEWVAEELVDQAFLLDDEPATCRANWLGQKEQNIRRWRDKQNRMPASSLIGMALKWDALCELLVAVLRRRAIEDSRMKASYIVTTVYSDGRPSKLQTRMTRDDAVKLARIEAAVGRERDRAVVMATVDRTERLAVLLPVETPEEPHA